MQDENKPSSPAVARRGIFIAGTLAILIGAFWLVAWMNGYAARHGAAGLITMKTNMALGQLLGGTALLLLGAGQPNTWRRFAGGLASSIVLLIGALALSEHLFGWNLGIDQFLAKEAPGSVATVSPNRIGPPGSLSLMLLSLGLLALAFGRRRIAPYLGIAVCVVNLLPAVGFLYGIRPFYSAAHLTGIAWPTVVALFSLGIGLALADRDGPISLLLRDDPGGALLRRLLPVVLLAPLVLGFLASQAERRGQHDVETVTGLLVITLILVFSAMLWRSAKHLSRSGAAHRAAEGERERLLAEIERRAAELDATLDSMVDGLSITEVNGRVLRMNAAGERMFGMTAGEMSSSIPERIRQLQLTKPDGTPMLPEESPTYRVSQGEIVSGLVGVVHVKDRTLWLSVNAAPILAPDGRQLGVVTTFTDITDLRKAEEALREANELLETRVLERTTELEQANCALEEEIADRQRAETAVAAERQRLYDVLETLPAYVVLLTQNYHVPFANRFFEERFGKSEGRCCYDYLFGRTEPCETCETYNALKHMAPHRWEWTGPDGRIYDIYDFPFADSDGSTLIMEMGIDITERKQAEMELEKHRDHLEELVKDRTGELEATNVQLQLEITEREKAEKMLHHQLYVLQRALLPGKPSIGKGYKLASRYIPAFAGEEVGGDFYDIVRTEDGKVGILIGDVSGKGIEAASLAASTRSTIRAFVYESSSPGYALSHANSVITVQQDIFGQFVTAFLLVLDPKTGDLLYSSAGHPPALVHHLRRTVEALTFGEIPIGLTEKLEYSEAQSRLDPGDRIVLYTDGVTEARRECSLFGLEGVERVLLDHPNDSPEELIDRLLAVAESWAEGRLTDDTAIIVVERE